MSWYVVERDGVYYNVRTGGWNNTMFLSPDNILTTPEAAKELARRLKGEVFEVLHYPQHLVPVFSAKEDK